MQISERISERIVLVSELVIRRFMIVRVICALELALRLCVVLMSGIVVSGDKKRSIAVVC